MEHLAQLGVVRLLGETVANGLHVTPRFAGLISALAHEILDCWDRLFTATPPTAHTAMLVPRAVEMLSLTMPTLLACLASEDMETSQETLGFLHSYIGRLRKLLPSKEDLSQHEGHLQHLLIVMGRKSLYPEDFAFDEADEGEEAFLAYRREISTLFKGVARVHASLAQEMVRSTLSSTLEAIHSVPWTHLEVALWLLHTLGEGLPEALLREKGGFFQQMMVTLISSSTSAYPHRAVQLLFFEIVVRYYRFFLVTQGSLPTRGLGVDARPCLLPLPLTASLRLASPRPALPRLSPRPASPRLPLTLWHLRPPLAIGESRTPHLGNLWLPRPSRCLQCGQRRPAACLLPPVAFRQTDSQVRHDPVCGRRPLTSRHPLPPVPRGTRPGSNPPALGPV